MGIHPGALVQLLPQTLVGFFALLMLLLGLGSRSDTSRRYLGLLALLGGVVALIFIFWQWSWVDKSAFFHGAIEVSRYSLFFCALLVSSVIGCTLLAIAYFSEYSSERGEYYALMFLSLLGGLMAVSSVDLISIYVSLELMLIPAYGMTAYRRRRMRGIESALKFFLPGAVSSAMLLLGIALTYGVFATTNLNDIAGFAPQLSEVPHSWASLGLAFMLAGLLTRMAATPFHAWLPDTYEGAPSPVAAFIDTAIKIAVAAVLVRLLIQPFYAFAKGGAGWRDLMWLLAIVSMSFGNLVAIVQQNLKRMLAYSSIANAGFILAATATLTQSAASNGAGALLYYLAYYVVVSCGLFAVVVLLGRFGKDKLEVDRDLQGFGYISPALGAAFSILLLALAGAPPSMGFFARFQIMRHLMGHGMTALTLVMLANMMVALYYCLRVVAVIYRKEKTDSPTTLAVHYPASLVAAIALCAVLALLLGVYPTPLQAVAEAAAASLF